MCKLQNTFFLLLSLAFIPCVSGQYTETINSNRPGESQGAFSVGTGVAQIETGFDIGSDSHSLRQTDTDVLGYNLALRYGLIFEKLELNGHFRFQRDETTFQTGNAQNSLLSGVENLQLGAKYLVYDPYKYQDKEVNLYSYHANNRFKWKSLIPAVSVYASATFDFERNTRLSYSPAVFARPDKGVSPTAALITQHNWGRWVWVNNVIVERAGTDFPTNSWISTLTHSFNPKFAGFAEFQLIDGELYSDYLVRAGTAYLITRNLQIDLSGLLNFKDTPSRYNISAGISYRLDFHEKDEIIKDRNNGEDTKSSSKRQAERINKKKRKDAVDPDGDGIN